MTRVRLYGTPDFDMLANESRWLLSMEWIREGLGLDPILVVPQELDVAGGVAQVKVIKVNPLTGERLTEPVKTVTHGPKQVFKYSKEVRSVRVRCAPPAELIRS